MKSPTPRDRGLVDVKAVGLPDEPQDSLNGWFIVWMLGLFAMVGLGASIAIKFGELWALPGIMLPYVYSWISSLFVPWTKEGWPCGARTMLGLLVGGMTVLWVIFALTIGW